MKLLKIFLPVLIGIFLSGLVFWKLRNLNQTIKIKRTVEDIKIMSPELVLVRFRIHSCYCIDRERNRIQIASLGFWKEKSLACWKLKTDVLAGYRWEELEFKKQGNSLIINSRKPEVLGVDYKGAELIYSYNWANLTPDERDFMSKAREETIKTAKELGILEEAELRLSLIGNLIAKKFGLRYQTKIISGL